MHGDEPTATCALLDLAHFLGIHSKEPWVADVLSKYTLRCVPMLNPDGAERGQRRNAQGIDINRDARVLQTPEGRFLRQIHDRFAPVLGFNLHNQNSLTTVGDTGRVATIGLLAVASDLPASLPGRPEMARDQPRLPDNLAKQVTAVLYEALSSFAYGHISRYDETYNPRAFGDNLALSGTPIVLLESGGNPAGQPADFGVKLNFVGLLAVLNSLSTGKIKNANPAVFDALKMNSATPIFDLLLRGAWICTGSGLPLFKGDVAIRRDLRAGSHEEGIIADLGDLGTFTAHEEIDCSGSMLTPGMIVWDKDHSPMKTGGMDTVYLNRGILTVLETVSRSDMGRGRPETDQWAARSRPVNWGFVVSGEPGTGMERELSLAEWLAAGGRGWIRASSEIEAGAASRNIPAWFGVESLSAESAARFCFPPALEGDPSKVIARWTSEAAQQFSLSSRGTIAVGAVADIVLWKTPSGDLPADIRDCAPVLAVVNGHKVDFSAPGFHGRFLGRP
jgi:hypothetical protein